MASCNACEANRLKKKLKENFLLLCIDGWPTVYEIGAPQLEGQGFPWEFHGRPIRFVASFMELAHSYDEDCSVKKEEPRAV